LLEIRELCAFYGRTQVLFGLDLAVAEGGVTTLLGANGAGKTTALRAVSGMVHIRGDIRFAGERIAGRAIEDIVRLGIAHVPEGRGTFVRQTVEENLQIGAMARSGRAVIAADVERVYGYFPRLKERRHQQAGTLSGGEQQMVAMARALMGRPRVICMDEPTMGLSPLIVDRVLELIQTVNRQGVTVFMVEQNAHLALQIADYGYVLQTGRIVLSGAASDLLVDPRIRDAYLGGRSEQ